jgi:hypothetical protein
MKNIHKKQNILCVFLLVMMLPLLSCEDFLTKTPPDNMSDLSYWKSENDVKSFMAGIYNASATSLGGSMHFWGDARADHLFPSNMYGGFDYQHHTLEITNGYANWNGLYTVIGRCNMAISRIPQMTEIA